MYKEKETRVKNKEMELRHRGKLLALCIFEEKLRDSITSLFILFRRRLLSLSFVSGVVVQREVHGTLFFLMNRAES
jgi:hypothetical protein